MPAGPELPWEAPLGAFPTPGGNTRFRVWAPRARELALVRGGAQARMEDEGFGVFRADLPAGAGSDYAYLVDGVSLPDPCSRWQPEGLRGPSRVLDPGAFAWTDDGWRAPTLRDTVLYELHVGTFTPEGTFEAAIPHLRALARGRDHHARADAGRRVPRRAAAGATTASTCPPPTRRTAVRSGSSGSSTPPTRRASRWCSTSSRTTSAPPASRRWRRSART